MYLNKNGWGIREMIVYCAILFVFLFIAVFMIYRFYHGMKAQFPSENNNPSQSEVKKTYADLEKEINDGALIYAADHYNLNGDTLTIVLENLVSMNYIKEINDIKDGKVCSGYALVRPETEGFISNAYIKCSNYTSSGYQDWRID